MANFWNYPSKAHVFNLVGSLYVFLLILLKSCSIYVYLQQKITTLTNILLCLHLSEIIYLFIYLFMFILYINRFL